jgi:hypothetical protein
MKPLKFLILAFSFIGICAFGQKDSSKVYPMLFLNGGLSVPAEPFMNAEGTSEIPAGFVSIFVSYPLLKLNSGIIASYTNSPNGVNKSTAGTTDFSGPFIENFALGGIFTSYKETGWVYSARIMAGVMYIKTPEFSSYSYRNDFYPGGPSSFSEVIDRANTSAFAYEFGLTVARLIGKKLLLGLNVDMYNSSKNNGPNWNSVSTSTSYSMIGQAITNYSYGKGTTSINVALFCFSFGVGYQFLK